jgi:hypothetical protein
MMALPSGCPRWNGWPAVPGLALGCSALDWRLAGQPVALRGAPPHDTRLSLGADNPIHLDVRNRSPRPVDVWVRDEAPDAFQIETAS